MTKVDLPLWLSYSCKQPFLQIAVYSYAVPVAFSAKSAYFAFNDPHLSHLPAAVAIPECALYGPDAFAHVRYR